MHDTTGRGRALRTAATRAARAWGPLAGGLLAALVFDGARLRLRLADRDREVATLRKELAGLLRQSAELADRLRVEARTDPLTGLANRRQWNEQLVHELDRARRTDARVAIAVVDLDRFKLVNDTRGHAAGDAVLRDVGARFAGAVRTVDVVARVGGEEFAVALPDVALQDAVTIVERLRTSLTDDVTCSAGLAVWDGEESAETLQRRADMALYQAKAAGRNRLVVA